MQIVVWLVCSASIALAAGVVQWKAARMRVELDPPQTVAGMEIRLPHGWMMKVSSQPGLQAISCREQPQGGGFGRALVVLRQSVKAESDPLEFLLASMYSEDGTDDADAAAAAAERISVNGHQGVVLEYQQRTLVGRTVRTQQQTAACIMLEGGNAVVIQYLGLGDPYGKNLVRQIAQSIHAVDDADESAPPRRPLPGDGTV